MPKAKYNTQHRKSRLTNKLKNVLDTYGVTRVVLAQSLGVDYKTLCGWTIGRTMPNAQATYTRVMGDLDYLLENVECATVRNTVQQGKPFAIVETKRIEQPSPTEQEELLEEIPVDRAGRPMFDAQGNVLSIEERERAAIRPTSALDVQVGGNHYKDSSIQPIQYIEANDLTFLEGSIVKRVTRHNKASGKGAEDLLKIIHEAQLILELRYDVVPTSGE